MDWAIAGEKWAETPHAINRAVVWINWTSCCRLARGTVHLMSYIKMTNPCMSPGLAQRVYVHCCLNSTVVETENDQQQYSMIPGSRIAGVRVPGIILL